MTAEPNPIDNIPEELLPYAAYLVSAARRTALYEAARASCPRLCGWRYGEARPGPLLPDASRYPVQHADGGWWHLNDERCPAGAIHELLLQEAPDAL